MFSTRVTGLPSRPSGLASAIPLMPDCAGPTQNASTSSFLMPALSRAWSAASMRGSSAPLCQCSVKRVQPMPMMATLSLMPRELTASPLLACRLLDGRRRWAGPPAPAPRRPSARRQCSPYRPRFPEVVGDAIGRRQPAERHLHLLTDPDLAGVDVGELDRQPPVLEAD